MESKSENATRGQAKQNGQPGGPRLRQLLLPMIEGIARTKQELVSWVHEVGLKALDELLEADAERIAGPKGKHRPERTHNHWGSTRSELPFGGRRIQVQRPRVRSKSGQEVVLPSVKQFQEVDPLPERVVEQILLGVTTRGYEQSLEPAPKGVSSRGTSKSAASRHLVARTRAKLGEFVSRSLENLELIGLMLDGIQFEGHTVVVALGITLEGVKVPLGLWLGSTENATVCTALLQDLLSRGLRLDERVLCVVDGGKGLRKALTDVLGDRAVVQRCQVHKRRNIREHLPEARQEYVDRQLREAYKSSSAEQARRRLRRLVSWLENNGEEDAAASLREGLEETLTVLKLSLPEGLRRSLSTTNAIENLLGSVRRVSRNVKRWRGGNMIRRWTALGVIAAQKRFRRIKGHKHLPLLISALRSGAITNAVVEHQVA